MLLKKGIVIMVIGGPIVAENFKVGLITVNETISPSLNIVRNDSKLEEFNKRNKVDLYIFVEEEYAVGEYIANLQNNKTTVIISRISGEGFKLVATTNTEIPSARLPRLFINQWVESEGSIQDVMVVYEENETLTPKKNNRNIIQLSSLELTHDNEYIVELFRKFVIDLHINMKEAEEWIKENI